jgi:hypothetical protein
MDDRFPNIRTLIVEKQGRLNYVCNNLLYAVCALASRFYWNIYLFLPIVKLAAIYQPHDTKKKAHQKLKIKKCNKLMFQYFLDKVIEYNNLG